MSNFMRRFTSNYSRSDDNDYRKSPYSSTQKSNLIGPNINYLSRSHTNAYGKSSNSLIQMKNNLIEPNTRYSNRSDSTVYNRSSYSSTQITEFHTDCYAGSSSNAYGTLLHSTQMKTKFTESTGLVTGISSHSSTQTTRKQRTNRKRDKKAKRKEKLREKREHSIQPEKTMPIISRIKIPLEKRKKHGTLMKGSRCNISVCIDLSWVLGMEVKDLNISLKEIRKTYMLNRHAKAPLQMHLTGYGGPTKDLLIKRGVPLRWDLHFHEDHFLDLFDKDKFVYLTSESENEIESLEEDKVYVTSAWGKNSHEWDNYTRAINEDIAHARFPVEKYFNNRYKNDKKILILSQVCDIILRLSQGKSFKEAVGVVFRQKPGILDMEAYQEYIRNPEPT